MLLDEDLPGLDEQAVLERLADSGALAGSSVIMLSTTGDDARAPTERTAGAFDQVVKPIPVPALVHHIRLALRATQTCPN